MSEQIKYPDGCILLPVGQLTNEDRTRQDFGNVQELAEDIRKFGLIQPLTVTRTPDGVKLVAGGRRLAALQLLGIPEVPCLFREEMSEVQLRELEFLENMSRKDFTWQEDCIHLYKLYKLREQESLKEGKVLGYREFQRFVRKSLGHISHALQVAPLILKGDEDILAQKSLVDAYTNVLLKRKEKSIIEKLGEEGIGTRKKVTVIVDEPDEADAIFDEDVQLPTREEEIIVYSLSKWLFHGDFREVVKDWPDGCVHHVVTDIPYGIDMKQLSDMTDIDQVVDAHDVQYNLELMPTFLKESFRLIGEYGYCVFWYDLDHHEKLQNWAKEAGFKVQRWPLIWRKLSPCKNNSAQYNWTKNIECAMVCRKGKAMLNAAQTSCVVDAEGASERKLYSNPFAKPQAVWRFILDVIVSPGEIVLDPFAGQMSSILAIIGAGAEPRAIELEKHHYDAGVNLIKQTLQKEGNVQFE